MKQFEVPEFECVEIKATDEIMTYDGNPSFGEDVDEI